MSKNEYNNYDYSHISVLKEKKMNPERIWTVYLHTFPKEITEYDYNKYYVGITS